MAVYRTNSAVYAIIKEGTFNKRKERTRLVRVLSKATPLALAPASTTEGD